MVPGKVYLQCLRKFVAMLAAVGAMLFGALSGSAQDTPLLSGGVGFFSNTNGGKTSYTPIYEPLLAAPIGRHLLIESRAALLESFAPNGGNEPGYNHTHYIALTYLDGAYTVTPHITVVGGSFLIPFGTYNERLSPIWIGNFQAGPIIANLGPTTGAGTGGMVRGSLIARRKVTMDYAAFFAARSSNKQFLSERASGGRLSGYLLDQRLEMGISYERQLQGTHENFYGGHVWWEPKGTALRLRSEFARGHHAQGYWLEADYRLARFGGADSWLGRFEPVFRMQQTFRRDTTFSDGLPHLNTQQADFGFDYNLPHNTRIITSYSREFTATTKTNIWQTGIVYRFLFPAWKGKGL